MTLLKLFIEFFIIGLCAFGGGLATIPFLEELSQTTGWFTLDQLADMIAISESTPGAIGINMSTYVGYIVGSETYGNIFMGFIGGVVGTLGLVAPSIIIILIISQFLKKFRDAKVVNWAFYGLRAASFGLICNAAFSIFKISIINVNAFDSVTQENFWPSLGNAFLELFDYKCLILGIVMGFLVFKFKKHPLLYILLAAAVGILFKF